MSDTGSTQEHLFEQYKLMVQSAEQISARRASANNYLLSVNSLLVTVHTLGKALLPEGRWQLVLPLAGFIICISWCTLIKSYRNVNAAKFKVIHELESGLPAQPFKDEWESMSKAHIPLSHVEQWIPVVFAAMYAGLFILAL